VTSRDRLPPPPAAEGSVAVGWATVELDRAAEELARWLGRGEIFADAPSSSLLGARCRIGRSGAAGPWIVLLEPSTEGRLAASLARTGEGWVAVWTADPPDAGRWSAERPGPLGAERLALGGPVEGPHRLLVRVATIRP
jgi:hypothetical protein